MKDPFLGEKKKFLQSYSSWLSTELNRCLPKYHSNIFISSNTNGKYILLWSDELKQISIKLVKIANSARHFLNPRDDKALIRIANMLPLQAIYLDDMASELRSGHPMDANTLYTDKFMPNANALVDSAEQLLTRLRTSLFLNQEEGVMDIRMDIVEKRVAEAIISFRAINVGAGGGWVSYPIERIIDDIVARIGEKYAPPITNQDIKNYVSLCIHSWLGKGWLRQDPTSKQVFYEPIGKKMVDMLAVTPDPESLRKDILKSIKDLEIALSPKYVADDQVARYMCMSIKAVQFNFELLKADGLISLAVSFGPRMGAQTTPFGRKSLEGQTILGTHHAKHKFLLLAADPEGATRLHLDEEFRCIDEALQKSKYRDSFDLSQHGALRIADLQGYLLRYQPNILHFSGHGSCSDKILMLDGEGHVVAIPVDTLDALFAALKDNIRCVVLNACYSEEQAKAIAKHIDCVIGMSGRISDESATIFATAFYQAIGYGKSVKTAFELGRVQIGAKHPDEMDIPKLLADKADPDKVVFSEVR